MKFLISAALLFCFCFTSFSFMGNGECCTKCARIITFRNGEVRVYDSINYFNDTVSKKKYIFAYNFNDNQTQKTKIPYSIVLRVESSDPAINKLVSELYK